MIQHGTAGEDRDAAACRDESGCRILLLDFTGDSRFDAGFIEQGVDHLAHAVPGTERDIGISLGFFEVNAIVFSQRVSKRCNQHQLLLQQRNKLNLGIALLIGAEYEIEPVLLQTLKQMLGIPFVKGERNFSVSLLFGEGLDNLGNKLAS
ncbi:hypothetical protein D3C73_1371640 [compost metagenome]